MRFEDVNEKIKRNANRVAAAFGVESWQVQQGYREMMEGLPLFGGQTREGIWIEWVLNDGEGRAGIDALWIDDELVLFWSGGEEGAWSYDVSSAHNAVLVRALYRLGFEQNGIVTDLESLLSAHEKMKLRLSLPREFRPKEWLEEESAT